MRTHVSACFLLLGLCAFSPPPIRAAEDADEGAEGPDHGAQVNALVEQAGIRPDGPGIGILVVGPDGVLFKKGYGLANLATKAPIQTSTTFELASVSKHMAGAAVLLLVQRGKVALDDDIRKHLPILPEYDPEHPITVDHLSRHTSGLPDYLSWDDGDAPAGRKYLTNADVVLEFAKREDSSPLQSVPGEKYEYSNSGYLLLGALVEKVSGQTFGTFLAKEFFGPLGMKTAWVHESPKVPTAAVAIGYTNEDGRWKATWAAPTKEKHEKVFTAGDGGVWASLDDMAGWAQGLLGGKPVKTETLAVALTSGERNSGDPIPYAMGWNVEYSDDGTPATIFHSGIWGGFQNYFTVDVGHGIAVLVLANRNDSESADLANAITALYCQ